MVVLNAGGGISGAVSGAVAGAPGGLPGIISGAVQGGAAGLFSKKNKKKKAKRISTFDPEQLGLYQEYARGLRGEGGQFGDLFNFNTNQANDVFNKTIGRPAYRQFEENIIPKISGQFRSNNLQNSSYHGDALSKAGRDVQEGLDAQRANYVFEGQQNAAKRKQAGLENILNMQTFAMDNGQEGDPSVIDQILSTVAPKAGEWFGKYLESKIGGSGATPAAANQPPEG